MKPEYQRRTSQVLDTQSSRQKEWSVACLRNWEDSMAGAERVRVTAEGIVEVTRGLILSILAGGVKTTLLFRGS